VRGKCRANHWELVALGCRPPVRCRSAVAVLKRGCTAHLQPSVGFGRHASDSRPPSNRIQCVRMQFSSGAWVLVLLLSQGTYN
jgi:hypothetical protein